MLANLETTIIDGVYKDKTSNTLLVDVNSNKLMSLLGKTLWGEIESVYDNNNSYHIITTTNDTVSERTIHIVKNSDIVVVLDALTYYEYDLFEVNLDGYINTINSLKDNLDLCITILELLGFSVKYSSDKRVYMSTLITSCKSIADKCDKVKIHYGGACLNLGVSERDCLGLVLGIDKETLDIQVLVSIAYDLYTLYGTRIYGYTSMYLKEVTEEHLLVIDLDTHNLFLHSSDCGNLISIKQIKELEMNTSIKDVKYIKDSKSVYLSLSVGGEDICVRI